MNIEEEDMSYVPHIPEWFDVRKASQVAAFFTKMEGGVINALKLAKLIYLADRSSLDEREFPITGDELRAMKFGPMNSHTYDYARGRAETRSEQWAEFMGPREGNELSLSRPVEIIDLDELSRADVRILEETWKRFRNVNQWTLADWTHEYCPEWSDPGSSSKPISYADVFRHLGKEDPEELERDILDHRRLIVHLLH